MRFAQFYHESTGWNGKDYGGPVHLIPKCGSDGVLPFDGRWGMDRCVDHARKVARTMPDVRGFTIEVGERYSNSKIVRKLEET
jgi:hypothetical protein